MPTLDFTETTVWTYVRIYEANIQNMHPLIIPKGLYAMVRLFLENVHRTIRLNSPAWGLGCPWTVILMGGAHEHPFSIHSYAPPTRTSWCDLNPGQGTGNPSGWRRHIHAQRPQGGPSRHSLSTEQGH
jgi:hypothetical protein